MEFEQVKIELSEEGNKSFKCGTCDLRFSQNEKTKIDGIRSY